MRYGRVLVALLAALLAATGAGAQEREAGGAPRGWLGIAFRPDTADDRERMVVQEVGPGSPAERAGLARGDVIIAWNGRADVLAALRSGRVAPGDTVRLRVRRGAERDRDLALVAAAWPRDLALVPGRARGEDAIVLRRGPHGEVRIFADSLGIHADSLHRRLRVLLEDSLGPRLEELERRNEPFIGLRVREAEEAMRRAFADGRFAYAFDFGAPAVAGAELAELNAGLGSYFGAERGVLVLRVAPGTPAARAGLEAGDVVVRVDGEEVAGVRELRRAVARAGDGEVRLDLLRHRQPRTLTLPAD